MWCVILPLNTSSTFEGAMRTFSVDCMASIGRVSVRWGVREEEAREVLYCREGGEGACKAAPKFSLDLSPFFSYPSFWKAEGYP